MGAHTSAVFKKYFLPEGLLLEPLAPFVVFSLSVILCLLQMKFKVVKIGGGLLIDYFPVKLVITDFLLVAATAGIIAFIAAWFPATQSQQAAFLN